MMMSVPFICPDCGEKTEVADDVARHVFKCPGCEKRFRIAQGRHPARTSWITWAVLAGAVLVVIMSLLPLVDTGSRTAVHRVQCLNNLRQCALALLNYEATFGHFPAAASSAKEGEPLHSWRVDILPFIEQKSLYDKYDFDRPWDSPENERVAKTMPSVFHCPSDTKADPAETNYVMITGPGTIGNVPNKGVRVRDITDGTSNTLLLIEVANSGIPWSEPRDITVDELLQRVNEPGFSPHKGGFNAVFSDCSAHFVPTPIDPEMLRRLVIRNDGKPVDLDKQ
jgi:hypothetical protein